MWNLGIPYPLKHLIDVIIQPTYTFPYDPAAGYTGLLTGRPAVVVYARGGAYEGDSASLDLQRPYLEQALGFMGITDVQSVLVEPTLMGGPDVAEQVLADARRQAADLAKTF